MTSRPRITDEQRRARLGRRHALASTHRVIGALEATQAMTVLHATEAASVHLAVAARTHKVTVADVDRALYDERTIVKQLAMRRTLFVFPRDLLPAAWASASARVADIERRRVAKAIERSGATQDGAAWFARMCDRVADILETEPAGLPTKQIRERVPGLDLRVSTTLTSTSAWAKPVQVAPWVLTQVGLEARAVRGHPEGHWRNPRTRWTSMGAWLEGSPRGADDARRLLDQTPAGLSPLSSDEGYAALIERYLRTFAPATENDIVWWLGSTKSAMRSALAALQATEVELDNGTTAYVLPGDESDDGAEVEPWAALLPTLDPTLMGWKERDFYLDPGDRAHLFDTNGNGGTSAWWNGRVVGCWVQESDGRVRTILSREVGRDGERALDTEAERMSQFLGGQVVSSIYASPLQRASLSR